MAREGRSRWLSRAGSVKPSEGTGTDSIIRTAELDAAWGTVHQPGLGRGELLGNWAGDEAGEEGGQHGGLPRVRGLSASLPEGPSALPQQDISFPLTPVAEEAGCSFERRQLLAGTFVSEFPRL